ncbi:MAG: alpha-glucan family phosphorylase [Chitinophagaceae bacterium]
MISTNNSLKNNHSPNFLFEVSWEVANKVGGIHTVLVSKHQEVAKVFGKNQIYIGPDLKNGIQDSLEFVEDKRLFKEWQNEAPKQGLKIRIGRWKKADNAITLLIDFSTFIEQKDNIFSHYWKKYGLDSLKGQWDYVEPAIFGHAVGKVIESFSRFHLSSNYNIVAHFHEWMTGTGLLYIKENTPQIGTIFTTHATALGRAIAGNQKPLYKLLKSINPQEEADKLQIVAKFSLEKITAQEADSFTTVSAITAGEAEYLLRPIDLITPNGFNTELVPSNYAKKRKQAKELLLKIFFGLTGEFRETEDTFFVGISGRYEYRNKGIDVFIKALGEINKKNNINKKIVAFILVPAGHTTPQQELINNMQGTNTYDPAKNTYLTHHLSYPDCNDPVLNTLKEVQIFNTPDQQVSCIFAPVYLDAQDGVFNLTYYDILCGLDLTCFPSYYEPWGYTPLESVAFKVPTITTDLAGYGLWVRDLLGNKTEGVHVIHRTDDNDEKVIQNLAEVITKYCNKSKKDYEKIIGDTKQCLEIAEWKTLYSFYIKAYQAAIEKAENRDYQPGVSSSKDAFTDYISKQNQAVGPISHPIVVQLEIPEKLKFLEVLSKNFWWSWNTKAKSLFCNIDKELWDAVYYNPADFLNQLSLQKFQALEKDTPFLKNLAEIKEEFEHYMSKKPSISTPRIAYFSMEYGLHSSFKIYSGGLGILAGDYLKECSDQGVEMVALGLYYRYGYFAQGMSSQGEQRVIMEDQFNKKNPVTILLNEFKEEIRIKIPFPGRTLYMRIWKVEVGRVPLYLLDTDIPENLEQDRGITHQLYGGNWENRLKQEMILGIGGAKLVEILKFKPDCYHLNEGHAALSVLERLRKYVEMRHFSLAEAIEIVRATSVFTTHTPVPAGHDSFSEYLAKPYLHYLTEKLNISWEKLFNLGKTEPYDNKFSMSYLAANLSVMINGVSKLHGEISKDIFKPMWKGYHVSELDIKYVTNGVHYPTWCASNIQQVFNKHVGKGFGLGNYKTDLVKNIQNIDNKEIWEAKQSLKDRLFVSIKRRIFTDLRSYYTPKEIEVILEQMNLNVLTFGFARRFATYKRATLLFRDLNRLNEIVNHPKHPVHFIFAGKAHPNDIPGQKLIQQIVQYSKRPEFLGKITFIANYDMQLSHRLVQGVDVWLNLPTRPLEASGTSGQKAVLNGTLHFSVLDGWWAEGYKEKAGWALPLEAVYENIEEQNDLDAVELYNLIEEDVVPTYYNKNKDNISEDWITLIKNSLCEVAFDYTTTRMLNDYRNNLYNPLTKRATLLKKNDYALAKNLASWKKRITAFWDDLYVESDRNENFSSQLILGQEKTYHVRVHIGQLEKEDVRVELLVWDNNSHKEKIIHYQAFKCMHQEENTLFYETNYLPQLSGNFSIGIRVYPYNESLGSRTDLALVTWV